MHDWRVSPVKIVLKEKHHGLACEDSFCQRATEVLHFVIRKGKMLGLCDPCYGSFLLRKPSGSGERATGGTEMAKGKEKKEKRVSAADVLIPQFGLQKVKDDEALIKLVKEATGSKKFDDKQLAWYKSQYRAGKLKGQNGKPGHLIQQGKLTKDKPAAKAKKVVVKAKKKQAEPLEA
jgi:hypothetical protein